MQEPIEKFIFADDDSDAFANLTIEYMKEHSIDEMILIVEKYAKCISQLKAGNIPQFSNLEKVDDVVQIVSDASEPIDYKYVGYMINKKSSEGAQTKYGENHLKLAIQMGLISNKPYKLTDLGKFYLKLSTDEKANARTKMFLRIPIVQYILVESKSKVVDGTEILKSVLADKTAIRRRSNTKAIINEICCAGSVELKKQIMNNIKWG